MFDLERPRQLEPDELAAWETKLVEEGMPSELVRPSQEVSESQQESQILDALRTYWMTREGSSYGDHKRMAQEVEYSLGLVAGTVDEGLVKSIEEEVAEAQRILKKIRDELSKRSSLAFRELQMERALQKRLRTELPHFTHEQIGMLIDSFPS